jgi:hypothetical protein
MEVLIAIMALVTSVHAFADRSDEDLSGMWRIHAITNYGQPIDCNISAGAMVPQSRDVVHCVATPPGYAPEPFSMIKPGSADERQAHHNG